MVPQSYSFLNTYAQISGPNGSIQLGAGAGNAEEGITIEASEDKNTLNIGADGSGQNVLNAGNHGVITVRFLKTSPTNAQLMTMYNGQKSGTANWGQNTITVADIVRGDNHTATGCAFKKKPTVVYSKVGPMFEWTFDAVNIDSIIGTGTPSING